MSLDEILRGFQAFNDGLQTLAVSKATNDAHAQVQALNAQQLDEKERLQAAQQIGQNLALRMQMAGANASDVQSATAGLLPSAGQQATNLAQQEMQKTGFENAKTMAGIQHGYRMEELGLKGQAKGPADDMKWGKYIRTQADTFVKRFGPDIENAKRMSLFKQLVADSKDVGTIGTDLAKRGLLKWSGDTKPSDEDLKGFTIDPSAAARGKAWISLNVKGLTPEEQKQRWIRLLDKIEANTIASMEKAYQGSVKSMQAAFPKADPAQYASVLRAQLPVLGDAKQVKVQYSKSQDMTRELDEQGNVIRTYKGRPQ